MSNQIYTTYKLSKEAGIAYLVEVTQLGDQQLGIQEEIKEMSTQVKGGSQETSEIDVLILNVGSNSKTHSVDMDQLM